jgi:hypothetical protein
LHEHHDDRRRRHCALGRDILQFARTDDHVEPQAREIGDKLVEPLLSAPAKRRSNVTVWTST